MASWHSIVVRVRRALLRQEAEAEMNEEMLFHLEMETRRNLDGGMDPQEARRVALLTFGGVEKHKDEMRDGTGLAWIGQLAGDVRLALRGLRRAPVFALVVVATIAIGLGATSAIFTAVQEVVLRPLPYPESERLTMIYGRHLERGIENSNVSYPDYQSWQAASGSFSDMGLFTWWSGTMLRGRFDADDQEPPSGTGEPGVAAERISGAQVVPELFATLGIEPVLGRTFFAEEMEDGQHQVVVIGHRLWQRVFEGREEAVGSMLVLDGEEHTVVGVMPRGFRFPGDGSAWVPLVAGEQHLQRSARFMAGAVGRLAQGVSPLAAGEELEVISANLEAEFPDSNHGWDAHLIDMRDNLYGPLAPALLILQGAVLLVLLVVCSNVACLLLARGLGRSREIAMRRALGADRRRLVTQFLVESLVLSTLGALAGIPLMLGGVDALRRVLVERLEVVSQLQVQPMVFAVTFAATALVAVAVGLAPALTSTRREGLRSLGGSRTIGDRGASSLRAMLVAGELAAAVVLLVGAGLVVRSLSSLENVDLGFSSERVLTARIALPEAQYDEPDLRYAAVRQLVERVETIPGVVHAGVARGIPFSGWNVHNRYAVEGEAPPVPGQESSAHVQSISPGFFEALEVGRPVGRDLDWDEPNSSVLVNRAFAERHWPDGRAVGGRIRLQDEVFTVSGVVENYRHMNWAEPMVPAFYVSWDTWAPGTATLAIKTTGDPEQLIPVVRSEAAKLLPGVPLYQIRTLKEVVSQENFNVRLVRNLLLIFAGVALALATLGLYAAIAYAALQRRREFGVRTALGATPRDLSRNVMLRGIGTAGLGVSLGFVLALGTGRLLESFLFEIDPLDPVAYLTVGVVAFGVTLLATWLPARSAARLDPVSALRD